MIEQGSQEWLEQRMGKVTASRVSDVMATIKTGEAAARAKYRTQLVCERISGVPTEFFRTAAMIRGNEIEPIARANYEIARDTFVESVGFVDHPSIKMAGASPDGLVGDDGLVEIKCPESNTHMGYLLSRKVPRDYWLQMQWQMSCTGRSWCDWVSFDDRVPETHQMLIIRVHRDDKMINDMKKSVIDFLAEVDRDVGIFNSMTVFTFDKEQA